MTACRIEDLPDIIKDDVEEFLKTHPHSPAARLRPKIAIQDEIWVVFVGPELHEGASGLGQTPRDALEDFNRNFMEPVLSRNGNSH